MNKPDVYTEECGWDGGDCVGMEKACENGMQQIEFDPDYQPSEEEEEGEETFFPSEEGSDEDIDTFQIFY